jgi:hypothetical protein
MSLRVGQRVKTIDGREGVVESVNLWRSDRFESIRDILTVRVDGIGDVYLSHQLTPMAEPARAKGWCNKPEGQTCVDEPASSYCDMALRCGWWVRPPAPHSYASRLSLITYPELFICSKAGECSAPCSHGSRHKRTGLCDAISWCPVGRASHTCIPYVPEDEAREWVVVFGPAFIKRTKAEAERYAKDSPDYRAFKWNAGLKGGE